MKVATDYNASLIGAGTEAAVRMLLGLPVLVTPAMTANTGLVVDKTQILSVVGPVSVASSEHALFSSDSILLRATWRFGAKILRPDRIGSFEVVEPEPVEPPEG
jgi:HK97 family phage major capsid protein